MSDVLKLGRYELEKLCVYGYIRTTWSLFDIDFEIPDDILKLFLAFYFIPLDRWNVEKCTEGMLIDDERNMATIIKGNWHHAFGTDIVKKGMYYIWKFNLTHEKKPTPIRRTLTMLIGIIESNKVSPKIKNHFIYAENGGYAYYTHLADFKHNGWRPSKHYGYTLFPGSQVTMTLDMTQKENENALLSYSINGIDYGVACDDIDIDKEYCMTVEMSDNRCKQSIQIVD